jgi:NAD(P)-dependent dehydrogenase (short-subunit alcohol dehydrogenase family)
MDLKGKVAWVTGGGSGIGRATALRFAKAGARVAVLGKTAGELNEVAEEIRRSGGEALAIEADLREPDQVQRAVQQVIGRWDRLDVVIANAGINGVWAPIEELATEEWDNTIEVNLRGTFLTLKYAIPHLKRRGGSIVITSSVNGTRIFSNAGATAYSCAKGAQVAMAKMAALELAKHRVRVNVVCPGAIDTPIFGKGEQRHLDEAREPAEFPAGAIPLTDGRPGTAEQVAELMLFLASDGASHITGTEIWIDGGESLLQG